MWGRCREMMIHKLSSCWLTTVFKRIKLSSGDLIAAPRDTWARLEKYESIQWSGICEEERDWGGGRTERRGVGAWIKSKCSV